MADNEPALTDAQIAAEFKLHGEIIQTPINHKKRKLLIKKLNHLRARYNRQNSTPSRPPNRSRESSGGSPRPTKSKTVTSRPLSPYQHDEDRPSRPGSASFYNQQSSINQGAFISDDSDLEAESNLPLYYTSSENASYDPGRDYSSRDDQEEKRSRYSSRSDHKALRFRTDAASQVGCDLNRRKNASTSSTDIHDEVEEAETTSKKSQLYPDLSNISRLFSCLDDTKETFESSDSDIEASTTANKPFAKSFSPTSHQREILGNISPSSSPNLIRSEMSWKNQVNGPQRVQQNKFSKYVGFWPGTITFFIILATTYLVLQTDLDFWLPSSSNIGQKTGSGDSLLLCTDDVKKDCFEKDVVDDTLQLLQALFEHLSTRKGEVHCGTAKPGDEFMQITHLKAWIKIHFPSNTSVVELMNCCLEYILANPHWNIRALNKDGLPAASLQDMAKLESIKSSKSISCRLRRSFNTVLSAVCIVIIVIGVLILLFMYIQYTIRQRQIEQQEVYAMVENIIEILQDHHEETKDEVSDELPYLAVQHVRDLLLPPVSRYELQPIWDKAVSFIAANESRIRTETRLIHNDEFEVWRWLQPTVLNEKNWKGKGGPNSNFRGLSKNSDSERPDQNIFSSTPCLKISNFFSRSVDTDNHWKNYVVEAVLERCEDIDSIVHVAVEVDSKKECHVFMKCSDSEAADQAREALHGWWFDGQKLTVSPMRTDHYHKRWPVARYAVRPLSRH